MKREWMNLDGSTIRPNWGQLFGGDLQALRSKMNIRARADDRQLWIPFHNGIKVSPSR